ncbi:hypothetical protein SSS_01331 [Sarcoptes scabiei]|nr:hypothetical protein SSS_01331 [Sarcoptes scabiei]
MILTSENQEKYRCFIPTIIKQDETKTNSTNKNSDLNPYQLLKPLLLKKPCSYRVENYWTYEICHGKYIRQYHEDSETKRSFYLGYFDMNDYDRYEKLYEDNIKIDPLSKLPRINVDDYQLPYIEVNMTDGTFCDLSNKKRYTKVLYVCVEDGKHELYSIKETTTCEYEVIAFSSLLCLSPKFKLKGPVENIITCHPIDKTVGTVPKGFDLNDLDKEFKAISTSPSSNIKRNLGDSFFESKTITIDALANGKEVHIKFITDSRENDNDLSSSLLSSSHSHITSKFLKGEYCLTGGTGWWNYEFCYGKTVNQYHEEKGSKKIIINLGKWNLDKHIEWIETNPSKKPKKNKTPKQVWHYYSDGDYCESTQRPRKVEVKLKCKNDSPNPDSVAIYLMEPKTCDYILGVESPIICDLLSTVNEHGLFDFMNNGAVGLESGSADNNGGSESKLEL